MSNVVNLADARRRATFASIFDDAQQLIEEHGPSAGPIATCLAKMLKTTDEERPYWIALAEEVERIQGYSWYTPDIGGVPGPERRAPARPAERSGREA